MQFKIGKVQAGISGAFLLGFVSLSLGGPNDSAWIQLFRPNDSTLSDWTPKIQGLAVGSNPYKSFSFARGNDSARTPFLEVNDTVNYNAGSYGYGHLFYKTPYSDYLLRSQYHFPSRQSYACNCNSGDWTVQNNGLMLHCQSAASMTQGQDYPQSFETQLLGYWSTGGGSPPNTTTGNLCLVNTTAKVNGLWYSDATNNHCTQSKAHSLRYDSSTTTVKGGNSSNTTWAGRTIWEYTMVRVLDSTSVTIWNRSRADTAWDSVFYYTSPHYGKNSTTSSPGSTTPVASGYISIQMEGTSTEFAKIELLNLVGCMTKTDSAYRSYFVKNDPALCSGVTGIEPAQRRAQSVFALSGTSIVATADIVEVEAFDLRGIRVSRWQGGGARALDVSSLKPGLYEFHVRTKVGSAQAPYVKL